MFINSIACLKVKGCGLIFGDRSILDTIAKATSKMIIKDSKRIKIKSKDFEGQITTKMEMGYFGSVVGYIFKIDIEGDEINRVTMDFILNRPLSNEDFEHGYWDMSILNEEQEKAPFN